MSLVELTYKIVRYSGLSFLFREVLFRKGVRIVTLHDPDPMAADRVIGYLKKRYRIIPLRSLLANEALPSKALVITLDDGHRGNAALLPVFRKHGVEPTIFLCSGLVGTNRHFWFTYEHLPKPSNELKKLPNTLRLLEMSRAGHTPTQEYNEPQALRTSEIAEMKEHVDLQSHGIFHPCLPYCSNSEAQQELLDSKTQLEQEHGLRVTAFAYPNGDYCQRELDILRRSDYSCALTMDFGFNTAATDRFRLKRLSLDDGGNVDGVSVKASGVWTLLRILIGKQRVKGYIKQAIFEDPRATRSN